MSDGAAILNEPQTTDPALPVVRPWLAAGTLCWRELIRFARQRNRVFGAIGQPIIFWVLFGFGLGRSFRLPAAGGQAMTYLEYFFPGTLALILLFTAIFATISIIEDRREGFLQSVLVAPLPRWSLVFGKLVGGTLIALVQGLIFLALGLTVGLRFSVVSLAAITAFSFLVAFALTALGFWIAWRLDSTQGFHAIMSVLLMPMWLLSGAFFPADSGGSTGALWLAWLMRLNPLTYGVAGLRRLIYWGVPADSLPADLPDMATSLCVTAAFAAVMFVLCMRVVRQRTTGDLL
ncbi:MAG TPA: ABC transporter permease [Pirellulales bacterium]|nr:ABC transporter permease [Pirellulales bacterium]